MTPLLIKSLVATAPLTLLSACATLGSHIGGDFSCPAPKTRCAPTAAIDAEALDNVSLGDRSVRSERTSTGSQGNSLGSKTSLGAIRKGTSALAVSDAALAARTGETILKIILPAHVDKAGVLREDAIVYAVVAQPHWVNIATSSVTKRPLRDIARRISHTSKRDGADPDSSAREPASAAAKFLPLPPSIGDEAEADKPDFPLSRSGPPLTLREAIAGAAIPAIGGLAFPPLARAPQPFTTGQTAMPGLPSEQALDAARHGHRIGETGVSLNVAQAQAQTAAKVRIEAHTPHSRKNRNGTKEDHKPVQEPSR